MDVFHGLMQGFQVAMSANNLLMCVVGVVLGTVIGVLPGLGPAATIAMLLPLTYKLDPTGAMIMLAGIYYGAKYGGPNTSILLDVPGGSSPGVTRLRRRPIAANARRGPARGRAGVASLIPREVCR